MAPTRTIAPGSTKTRKLTVADYMAIPDDGRTRYEILDGALFMSPAPIPRHQLVSKRLELILIRGLEEKGKGVVFHAPIDVVLDDHTVAQPDILFIRAERSHIIGPKNIQGAPDLVIEILSPSTRDTDLRKKLGIYARRGVAHYWIADPKRNRLDILRREGMAYTQEASLTAPEIARPKGFPRLKVPLGLVFA